MDHNNYLIGSVGVYVIKFMTKYVDYMYPNNAHDVKVQLPLPNPKKFLL